jgi:hypothetical protein
MPAVVEVAGAVTIAAAAALLLLTTAIQAATALVSMSMVVLKSTTSVAVRLATISEVRVRMPAALARVVLLVEVVVADALIVVKKGMIRALFLFHNGTFH